MRTTATPRPPLNDPVLMDLITCPVTKEIFYNPKIVNGCGHVFEADAIKRAPRCPCCRKPIKRITPALTTKTLVEHTITQYPALQDERYFRISNLVKALQSENTIELDKLCKILKSSSHLHATSDEEDYKGSSAYTILCLSEAGKKLLTRWNLSEEYLQTEAVEEKTPYPASPVSGGLFSTPVRAREERREPPGGAPRKKLKPHA